MYIRPREAKIAAMAGKEALLEALIRPKLVEIGDRLKFWYPEINWQEGEDWVKPDSLTLEKFISMKPRPESDYEVTLYGIAWEFVWGKAPPEEVAIARENLIRKAGMGEDLTPLEELWLKLITVDTDIF